MITHGVPPSHDRGERGARRAHLVLSSAPRQEPCDPVGARHAVLLRGPCLGAEPLRAASRRSTPLLVRVQNRLRQGQQDEKRVTSALASHRQDDRQTEDTVCLIEGPTPNTLHRQPAVCILRPIAQARLLVDAASWAPREDCAAVLTEPALDARPRAPQCGSPPRAVSPLTVPWRYHPIGSECSARRGCLSSRVLLNTRGSSKRL